MRLPDSPSQITLSLTFPEQQPILLDRRGQIVIALKNEFARILNTECGIL